MTVYTCLPANSGNGAPAIQALLDKMAFGDRLILRGIHRVAPWSNLSGPDAVLRARRGTIEFDPHADGLIVYDGVPPGMDVFVYNPGADTIDSQPLVLTPRILPSGQVANGRHALAIYTTTPGGNIQRSGVIGHGVLGLTHGRSLWVENDHAKNPSALAKNQFLDLICYSSIRAVGIADHNVFKRISIPMGAPLGFEASTSFIAGAALNELSDATVTGTGGGIVISSGAGWNVNRCFIELRGPLQDVRSGYAAVYFSGNVAQVESIHVTDNAFVVPPDATGYFAVVRFGNVTGRFAHNRIVGSASTLGQLPHIGLYLDEAYPDAKVVFGHNWHAGLAQVIYDPAGRAVFEMPIEKWN